MTRAQTPERLVSDGIGLTLPPVAADSYNLMARPTSRTDRNQISVNFGCGCHFVAWKLRQKNAETYGWHLCPDHMEGFQKFRQTRRREFRVKHPCRCYYVVWGDIQRDAEAFGWHLCAEHAAEYQAFQGQP